VRWDEATHTSIQTLVPLFSSRSIKLQQKSNSLQKRRICKTVEPISHTDNVVVFPFYIFNGTILRQRATDIFQRDATFSYRFERKLKSTAESVLDAVCQTVVDRFTIISKSTLLQRVPVIHFSHTRSLLASRTRFRKEIKCVDGELRVQREISTPFQREENLLFFNFPHDVFSKRKKSSRSNKLKEWRKNL